MCLRMRVPGGMHGVDGSEGLPHHAVGFEAAAESHLRACIQWSGKIIIIIIYLLVLCIQWTGKKKTC